jgi:hypothetical protein
MVSLEIIRIGVFFASVSLCFGGSSLAALDPELTVPYKVKIVLRVARHPLLTPVFKDRLQREVRDGLQGALGAMGEVEIVDASQGNPEPWPPLWKEVETKGLKDGLDGPSKGTSDQKTHFVWVDYVDGQYEIQARQYDGLTGLASPTVRQARTLDRQFVARTAALLVDRDFGLVGTVMDGSDPAKVRVAFKGGGLKVPLERWVKPGEILALVQVSGGRTTRVPWALLQIQNSPGEDGSSLCAFFSNQAKPRLESSAAGGYRCLKLGTITAPLRLRLVKASDPKTPAPSLEIHVRRHGFTQEERDKVQGVTDADGYFSTERKNIPPFQNVAFVSIMHAGQARAQVPLAIVDERPIPCRVNTDATSLVMFRKQLWEKGLLDEIVFLQNLIAEFREQPKDPKNGPHILARAKQAWDQLGQDISLLEMERKELEPEAAKAGFKSKDWLANGDLLLLDVQKGRGWLRDFIAGQEKVLKEENDPTRQKALALRNQARLLEEGEAEYGKAIELYEEVLKFVEDPKVKEHLDKLKEAWKTRDEAHASVRTFIFQTWPKVDPANMKNHLKEAEKAFQECRRVKDPLGPRRLAKVATVHVAQLTKQHEALKPTVDVNEDDRKVDKELTEILDNFEPFLKELNVYLTQVPPP